MENKLQPIKNHRVFKSYFDDDVQKRIFYLDETDAKTWWSEVISNDRNHYFKLADDHWFFNSKKVIIANWMEHFRSKNYSEIFEILSSKIQIEDDEKIYFIINSSNVIVSDWVTFKEYWSDFLCVYDDSPIIMRPFHPNSAIIFDSSGSIIELTKNQ